MTDQSPKLPGVDLTIQQYEQMLPAVRTQHNGVVMTFVAPSELAMWRAQTIRQKEPWTLEWIDTFERDEILVDCGANVGMYTIWAAATRGARVYAFEPEAQNYGMLNRNIMLNRLSGRVMAYCLGLSDTAGLSDLHMSDLRAGSSCHSVGEDVDYKLEPRPSLFIQGCVVARLDDLIAEGKIPVPNHIKIDVDGFEHKVIAGARKTLEAPALKSLLIEINQSLPDHMGIVRELADLGFGYEQAQVDRAERKEGAFKGVAEYIFRR